LTEIKACRHDSPHHPVIHRRKIMAERLTRQLVAEKAIVHAEIPAATASEVDRTFEMPTALYTAMAALFAGFIVVTGIGFREPEMILPMGICAVFLIGIFGVPAVWVRMRPETASRAKSWDRFKAEGIQTPFGHVTAREATIQMLILPVLILLWGIAVVTIAALA
jgi:hypothetical protein